MLSITLPLLLPLFRQLLLPVMLPLMLPFMCIALLLVPHPEVLHLFMTIEDKTAVSMRAPVHNFNINKELFASEHN